MARGQHKKGGRGGSASGRGRGGKQSSGIEKYGKDATDEFLDLDDGDDDASEASEAFCDEEEVMGLEADDAEVDNEEWSPPKVSAKAKTKLGEDDEDAESNDGPATKDWRRNEFYGGDDAGDGSGDDSDEDLVFKEAKRLEELRARQLAGEEDVLASLLAAPSAPEEPAPTEEASASGLRTAAASAQFESVFAGEAEQVSVSRDISQLPDAEKKSLLKKEAPELMPLLGDFKAKLKELREILPLLQLPVLKNFPASGVTYLEAKAALLLNTLVNLSFYLLLRAEGGAVRAHPVVPQLVWLRELQEQLAPLDGKLGPKLRKALTAAKRTLRAETSHASSGSTALEPSAKQANGSSGQMAEDAPVSAPRRKTLRERLERLHLPQASAPVAGRASAAKQDVRESAAALSKGLLTKDLLRLPKARQPAAASGSASAPLDLEDVDPTLGVWAPKSTLGEQLSAVQQQLREQAAHAKVASASADQNTEARPRRTRDRGAVLPEEDPRAAAVSSTAPVEDGSGDEDEGDDDDDEDDLIKTARKVARSKKETRNKAAAARAEAKETARRLREFHPEKVIDERRKTSKKILDNRGLQRVRKKHAGNARVANKERYGKAIKRRKGAVQEIREGAADGTYEGEETGVRTHLQKSRKIN